MTRMVLGAVVSFVVALVAWVWVVNRRYPGGWVAAAAIGVVAWAAALAVIFVLNGVLDLGITALGVLGV